MASRGIYSACLSFCLLWRNFKGLILSKKHLTRLLLTLNHVFEKKLRAVVSATGIQYVLAKSFCKERSLAFSCSYGNVYGNQHM